MKTAAALLLAVIVAGGGCRTLTGRTAGQWADDRAITARVKAWLSADAGASTLTRIHVDTYEGTVYLTGAVASPEQKADAERIAREVPNVALVVNNLHMVDGGETADDVPSASPATGAAAARDERPRALAGMRLEWETGTPAWRRYAAYDARGARVATAYAVAAADAARGVGD
ncbi:MAG: BON domain-containing protein, partial [Candidatus Rokuibacteriota bacterium]